MDYPAYPGYRESGIEWLGNIPDHWELKKFRFLFSFGRGLGITKENLLDEGIPCINYGEIHSKYGFEVIPEKHPLKCVTPDYLETGTSSLLSVGDFVFADTSEDIEGSGNFSHLNSDTPTFAGYHTVIARSISNDVPRYMAYLFDSLPYRFQIRKMVSGVKVFSITQAILKNCYLWLPQKTEQIQIAQFLDHKTQQIDQLIAKKQTLIDKLNEQRIALITHAVTKGLNPDVKMKDSGVEWLGEVPEHWEVSKLGYFSESLQTGPFGSQIHAEEYIDGGIPLINPAEIINGTLRYNPRVSVDDATAERLKRHQLIEGDIVIGRRGEMGRAGLTKKENVGWLCGTGSLRARLETDKLMPEYLLQLFSLAGTADYLSLQSVGSTMDNLNTSILNQLPIIIPPMEEQREIVAYLDRETARIDRMVELNQQTIDKLKEYRTALITAVVTGKIDVRNWRQMETKGV